MGTRLQPSLQLKRSVQRLYQRLFYVTHHAITCQLIVITFYTKNSAELSSIFLSNCRHEMSDLQSEKFLIIIRVLARHLNDNREFIAGQGITVLYYHPSCPLSG